MVRQGSSKEAQLSVLRRRDKGFRALTSMTEATDSDFYGNRIFT
jgi:hypothetical protein